MEGCGAYAPLPLSNGFHEKASLVKVNVVTEAETKAAKRTPLATLPFALSVNLLFGGSVHDGFRPGRALQSKSAASVSTRAIWRSHRDHRPSGVLDVRRCFIHLGLGSSAGLSLLLFLNLSREHS